MYSIFEMLLQEKGVTVADVCRATGIKQSTMSNWKKRGNRLHPDNAILVAKYFGVSIDYLYGNNEQSIMREIQGQSLFESQLKLDGWKIEHDDPAKDKPCKECQSLGEINGVPWWAHPDGVDPGKLCDKCVINDAKHILSKGDIKLTFTNDEYREIINRNQYETIESILKYGNEGSDDAPCRIPVVRRVAAGIPIDSIQEIIGWEEIPSYMAKSGTYFGLKIQGNSMEPGIADGDIVIVRDQPDAEDGQIVVALVNGDDGCCKRLKKYDDGSIALMSDNPQYQPMYFNTSEIDNKPVVIRGVVKELRRSF